ncbi:MAG: hypothetical protein H0V20_08600 [Actinobacteria bacterium]|nr:hypothetical protein [Actinomycetota bacterium]
MPEGLQREVDGWRSVNPSAAVNRCWTGRTTPWFACDSRAADDVGYVFLAETF